MSHVEYIRETCPKCGGETSPPFSDNPCAECGGLGHVTRQAFEPASGIDHDAEHAELLRTRDERDQAKRDLVTAAEQLGALQTAHSRQGILVADLIVQRQGLERKIQEVESTFTMYRNAWVRELGGRVINKRHDIDGLVLTTRALREFAESAWSFVRAVDKSQKARPGHPTGKFAGLLELAKKAGFGD